MAIERKIIRETLQVNGKTYVRDDQTSAKTYLLIDKKKYVLESPEETEAAEETLQRQTKIFFRPSNRYDNDPAKTKQIMDMDSKENLPDTSNQPPYGFDKRFEVSLTKPPSWACFYCLAFFFLIAFMVLIKVPATELAKYPLPILFVGALGVMLPFLARNLMFVKSNPVLLEVYDHGIWFNWKKVFIPYERIQSVRVREFSNWNRVATKLVCCQALLKKEDIRRMGQLCYTPVASVEIPVSDAGRILFGKGGTINVLPEEALEKIKELAIKNNERGSFPAPDFSVDQ